MRQLTIRRDDFPDSLCGWGRDGLFLTFLAETREVKKKKKGALSRLPCPVVTEDRSRKRSFGIMKVKDRQ